MTEQSNIPLGMCQCGCGEPTTLIKESNVKRGYVKGQPNRFIAGHSKDGGGWNRGMQSPILPRILASTIPVTESGCLVWLGATERGGYGHIFHEGKMRKVHRIMFELFNGPIPEGAVINHICAVRCCVRPEHLEAITQRENLLHSNSCSRARMRATQTHCIHGHEFTPENTYHWRGGRLCRACRAVNEGARRAKQKEVCNEQV